MRSRTPTDALRTISTVVAITSAFAVAGISFFGKAFQLDTRVLLGVILAVLGSLLLYVFGRAEKLSDDLVGIRASLAGARTDVEVFNSRDEWANRLTAESLRSVEVSTQMFSDVRLGRDMDDYFARIHREIRETNLPFRRMASTGSAEKVRWLFDLLAEMYSTDSFSLGVIDVDHTKVPLTAFQICRRGDGNYSVFIFSSNIFEPGTHTCLITDRAFGEFAQRTYNAFWDSASTIKLKDGPRIHWDRIRELANRYGAARTREYAELMRLAEPRRA
ncbi:MAG TPA: hypothetical protein VE974_25455 [Thermoanaerobaculia bacterium]|nr:hypothetical protein [Thermoanaerobaculia bacterium]